MQRLANLEILIDDSPSWLTEFPSSTTQQHPNHYNFRIVLVPSMDREILRDAGTKPDRTALQSILAHELGHFVAYITNDPTHDDTSLEAHAAQPKFPTESKAWDIAEGIMPNFDRKLREFVLDEYKKEDETEKEENKND